MSFVFFFFIIFLVKQHLKSLHPAKSRKNKNKDIFLSLHACQCAAAVKKCRLVKEGTKMFFAIFSHTLVVESTNVLHIQWILFCYKDDECARCVYATCRKEKGSKKNRECEQKKRYLPSSTNRNDSSSVVYNTKWIVDSLPKIPLRFQIVFFLSL